MQETVNVGKWFTFVEYYDEDGVQISKREALKHYIKIHTEKIIKINGNTGTRTWRHICEKDKQLKLF